MGNYTTNLSLYKPTVATEIDWGALVNTNFDLLDTAVGTTTPLWTRASTTLSTYTAGDALSLGGLFSFTGAEFEIANTDEGQVRITSTGNTNGFVNYLNVDLGRDWQWGVTLSAGGTGGSVLRYNSAVMVSDDTNFVFGNESPCDIRFDTTGGATKHVLRLETRIAGTNNCSGYIFINNQAHDRVPANTVNNPTLRIYSSDVTEANSYLQLFHNQTDAVIDVGYGDLNLMQGAVGNVVLFDGTDVGDDDPGKRLRLYRKAAEGDAYVELYFDAWNSCYLQTTSSLFLDAGSNVTIGYGSGCDLLLGSAYIGTGKNPTFRHYGWITALGNESSVSWQLSDTDDYYWMTRETADVLGFKIDMPVNLVDNAFVTTGTLGAGAITGTSFTDSTATLTGGVGTGFTLTSPVLNTGVSGTAVLDEDAMGSDSATQLATQQSIKAYADTKWEHLATTALSTTASVEIQDMEAGYDYMVLLENCLPSNDEVELQCQTSDDAGGSPAYDDGDPDSGYTDRDAVNETAITISSDTGNAAGEGISAEIIVWNPNTASNTQVSSRYMNTNGTTQVTGGAIRGGRRNLAGISQAIKFFFAAGTMASGNFRVYRRKVA